MSGFWAGAVPPWLWVVGGCLLILAILLGAWYGYERGWKHRLEEERWAREQAKARRIHPVYRQPRQELMYGDGPGLISSTGTNAAWLAHEDQALTIANETADECPACHDTYVDLHAHLTANLKGCEDPLEPTAVLTPEEASWTGEIQRMTAAFQEDMARLLGGTDEQLREITR